MFKSIQDYISSFCPDYIAKNTGSQVIQPLFMRGDKWNIVFIFFKNNSRPVYVIEIAKGKSGLLNKAAENMRQILSNPNISQYCPKVFYFGAIGKDDMLVQEACPGIPMQFILQRALTLPWEKSKEQYILMATDWLKEFHSSTISRELIIDHQFLKDYLSGLLGFSQNNRGLEDLLNSVMNKRLTLVMSHNDFIPSNILIDNHSLKILDWEYANSGTLPLSDLFGFLLSAYRDTRQSSERLEIFINKVFFNRDCLNGAVRKAVKVYCQAFNIDRDLARVLFLNWLCVEFSSWKNLGEVFADITDLFNYI